MKRAEGVLTLFIVGLSVSAHAATDLHGDLLPPGALARAGTVRFAHGGAVQSVAVSSDGRWVASQGASTVRMWSARDGRERWRRKSSCTGRSCLSFGKGGDLAVFGGGRVVIYDPASGRPRRTVRLKAEEFGGADPSTPFARSPDGAWLAYRPGFFSKDVELRRVDGSRARRLSGKGAGATALAFSPDSKWLAMARAKRVEIWEVSSGRLRHSLSGHPTEVGGLGYLDARTLVSTSSPKGFTVWDAWRGKRIRTVGVEEKPTFGVPPTLAVHPGARLVVVRESYAFRVWGLAPRPELLWTVRARVDALGVGGRGALVATGGSDQRVRLWDLLKNKEVRPQANRCDHARHLVVASDGKSFRATCSDGTIRTWRTRDGSPKKKERLSPAGFVYAATPIASGGYLASYSPGEFVQVLGTRSTMIDTDSETIRHIARVPGDDSIVVTGTESGNLSLWRLADRRRVTTRRASSGEITALAIDPRGRWIATGGEETEVRLWKRDTLAPMGRLTGLDDKATTLAITPDGSRVVAAAGDEIYWWSVGSGELVGRWELACTGVRAFDFSPDGKRLACGCGDGSVRLLDPGIAMQVSLLRGHQSGVSAIAFTPDGRRLISTSDDATALVWEVAARPSLSQSIRRSVLRRGCGPSDEAWRCDQRDLSRFTRKKGNLGLEVLSLEGTEARDLSPLRRLRNLRQLSLRGASRIKSLAPLVALKHLRHLDLAGTSLRDLAQIGRIEHLESLSLARTAVVDLEPLQAFKRLRHLDLSWTWVRDLSPLKSLPHLRSVRLAGLDLPPDATKGLEKIVDRTQRTPSSTRIVVNRAGSRGGSGFGSFVTLSPSVAWHTESRTDDDTWSLRRAVKGFAEGIVIQKDRVRLPKPSDLRAAHFASVTSPEETAPRGGCSAKGVCNVTLLAGKSLPAIKDPWWGIDAVKPLRFARPMRVCRFGPIYSLQPHGKRAGWLAPSVLDIDPRLMVHADAIRVTAGGQVERPPPCAGRESGVRKTPLFSQAPKPIMGLFLLTEKAAKAVDAEKTLKRSFFLAKRLATRKWVYHDRWCDDAVRQAMLMGEDLDWRRLTLTQSLAKARTLYWRFILLRHAMMYHAYEPKACRRALRRKITAAWIAARKGYRLRQFGY